MDLAQKLGEELKKRKLKLVIAESCTGGGLAYAITAISGSSDWFERGFITYSNQSKEEMLGVKPEIIKKFGAVSEETAIEMAQGALSHSAAQLSIAITGIAGPDGGTADKPVGTVWIAYGKENKIFASHFLFPGERDEIRHQAIEKALQQVWTYIIK